LPLVALYKCRAFTFYLYLCLWEKLIIIIITTMINNWKTTGGKILLKFPLNSNLAFLDAGFVATCLGPSRTGFSGITQTAHL